MTAEHRAPAVLAVGVGGVLGTLVRAGAETAWPAASGRLPAATLLVNLVGAFLLGLLLGHLALAGPDDGARRLVRLGLGTGFMGGLTTYSTLVLESAHLTADRSLAVGAAYLIGSLVAGIAAAAAGLWVAGRLRRRTAP